MRTAIYLSVSTDRHTTQKSHPLPIFPVRRVKIKRFSCAITPLAGNGIPETIHWKPQMVCRIERLRVLKPISFETLRRKEAGSRNLGREDRSPHPRRLDPSAPASESGEEG
jgi:hypothetical protein